MAFYTSWVCCWQGWGASWLVGTYIVLILTSQIISLNETGPLLAQKPTIGLTPNMSSMALCTGEDTLCSLPLFSCSSFSLRQATKSHNMSQSTVLIVCKGWNNKWWAATNQIMYPDALKYPSAFSGVLLWHVWMMDIKGESWKWWQRQASMVENACSIKL